MSHAPPPKDKDPEVNVSSSGGRSGHGVASVLPYLQKQTQVKIPVPIDDLPPPDSVLPATDEGRPDKKY